MKRCRYTDSHIPTESALAQRVTVGDGVIPADVGDGSIALSVGLVHELGVFRACDLLWRKIEVVDGRAISLPLQGRLPRPYTLDAQKSTEESRSLAASHTSMAP